MVAIIKNTKYSTAVLKYLQEVGHATNAQILSQLRKAFPALSATTIHRITTRLSENGLIRLAPNDSNGDMRYDANLSQHDHFLCSCCGALRDVNLSIPVIKEIESQLNGCRISGNLVINGSCGGCNIKEKEMFNVKNYSL